MKLEIWIILIEFITLTFTRSGYRFLNPQWTNTDAFAHFNIMREIKNNNHRIPEGHSRTFHPGKFTYPPLLHIVLSVIPERYFELTDKVFSVAVDLLFAVLLFTLVPLGILDLSQMTVVLALFVAAPQFVRPDHPHGVGLSARKPGILLFSTGIAAFLLWMSRGEAIFFIIAVVMGGFLPLTSRFSTQAFLFTSIVLSIFYTPLAIGYFFASLVFSLIFSGGYYWRVLTAHILFSVDFAKIKQYKFLYNGFKSIDTTKRFIRGIKNKSIRDILETLFDSILLRSLFDNPFVMPIFAVLLFDIPNTSPQGYLIWIYSGFGAYILTSVYHLRFLGHAGRYLEHIFLPSAVVAASAFSQHNIFFDWIVYICIFIGLSTIIVYIIIQQRWTDTTERDSLASLIDQLQTLPTGRVLIQPRYGGSEIAWKTSHSVNDFLGTGFNSSEVLSKRNQLYPKKEGWVTDDTAWLSSEFNPDWIVFDRRVASNSPEDALSEPDREPLWESESYALYKFEALTEGSVQIS